MEIAQKQGGRHTKSEQNERRNKAYSMYFEKAFNSAIKSKKNGTYDIASGASLSISELAKHVLSSLGKKFGIIRSEKQKDGMQNSQADITLTKKELGLVPTNVLKEGSSNICHEKDWP